LEDLARKQFLPKLVKEEWRHGCKETNCTSTSIWLLLLQQNSKAKHFMEWELLMKPLFWVGFDSLGSQLTMKASSSSLVRGNPKKYLV